uniref:Uncharacterized protein n=1 Tax=Scophthalmus maximus TaxID=52904 RepID=A0A8D3CSN6_SCOMX
MCVSRCLQCVGVSLVPMAIICILSNILLLLPELKIHFLLEVLMKRHVWFQVLLGARAFVRIGDWRNTCLQMCDSRNTCLQMMCQVLHSGVCLLAAGICCLVSATGLVQGPLCLYNTTTGPTWGVPLHPLPDSPSQYLYNRTLWSVCLRPHDVVQWNVVLFSVMGGASALQTVLCAANVLNSLLGLILGHGSSRKRQITVNVRV